MYVYVCVPCDRVQCWPSSKRLDEQPFVLILLVVAFAYVLSTMVNADDDDEEEEDAERSAGRSNKSQGKSSTSSEAGNGGPAKSEMPSLFALLSRRTTMLHRLSDWQVTQATPSAGGKPFTVLIAVRVSGGANADRLVREAVAAALLSASSTSTSKAESARERLAQLGLEQAALAWAELDALARKFATDPVCFRFIGPGATTNDRATIGAGEGAAATTRYVDWLSRLLEIGDPASEQVLQRIRASMESVALVDGDSSSSNNQSTAAPVPAVGEAGGSSSSSSSSSVDKGIRVYVDGIWIVHLRRVKVRLFAPLAAEFPTTLERVGAFAHKGVLERWITKVFDGQLSVPQVSGGLQDKSTYWPPTP
jgi:hypothetical protein